MISVGDQYGSWTVIDEGPLKGRNQYYLCRCACGKEKLVQGGSLRNGRSKSCGCSRYPFVSRDLSGLTLGTWTVLERLVDAWGGCFLSLPLCLWDGAFRPPLRACFRPKPTLRLRWGSINSAARCIAQSSLARLLASRSSHDTPLS